MSTNFQNTTRNTFVSLTTIIFLECSFNKITIYIFHFVLNISLKFHCYFEMNVFSTMLYLLCQCKMDKVFTKTRFIDYVINTIVDTQDSSKKARQFSLALKSLHTVFQGRLNDFQNLLCFFFCKTLKSKSLHETHKGILLPFAHANVYTH